MRWHPIITAHGCQSSSLVAAETENGVALTSARNTRSYDSQFEKPVY